LLLSSRVGCSLVVVLLVVGHCPVLWLVYGSACGEVPAIEMEIEKGFVCFARLFLRASGRIFLTY